MTCLFIRQTQTFTHIQPRQSSNQTMNADQKIEKKTTCNYCTQRLSSFISSSFHVVRKHTLLFSLSFTIYHHVSFVLSPAFFYTIYRKKKKKKRGFHIYLIHVDACKLAHMNRKKDRKKDSNKKEGKKKKMHASVVNEHTLEQHYISFHRQSSQPHNNVVTLQKELERQKRP